MLIAFTGYKGSGKDTSAKILIDKYNFTKYAFADPLKECCKNLFRLNEEQLNGSLKETIDERWGISPRKIFQILGTNMIRDTLTDYFPEIKQFLEKKYCIWSYLFKLWYEENKHKNVVITDVRFPDEYDTIINNGGIVIKINKVGANSSNDCHISETNIDNMKSHYTIDNDGTIEELHQKIILLTSSL